MNDISRNTGGGKFDYSAPTIDLIRVQVEEGFQNSPVENYDSPFYEDATENDNGLY